MAHRTRLAVAACSLAALASGTRAGDGAPTESDLVVRDFSFDSGERIAELRLHYRTLGTPRTDASGRVVNAVLLLHGTGGSGSAFLAAPYQKQLYGPGQPLDLGTTFVILPDSIGHGGSSKPSDGLQMRFPRYDYKDMVRAQRLVVEHLGASRLRLVLGTSMGGMHAWL